MRPNPILFFSLIPIGVFLATKKWDLSVVIALVVGWISWVGYLVWKRTAEPIQRGLPSAAEREDAARKLWQLYPALPDEEPDSALFLLDHAKTAYDGWIESNGRIEAKATRLMALLAGGAGLLTVIGSLNGEKSELHGGPFLALALIAASGCLLSCLYILRPKLRSHPSVAEYVNPALALSPKSRFHIALSLAEEYNRFTIEIARLRKFDPVAWTASQVALAVAVIAILCHFFASLTPAESKPTVVQCQGQQEPFRSGLAWKTTCKE